MWTRRRIFPTLEVPATPHPAALSTPLYHEQCSDKARVATFALEDNAFNFVAGLGYTLVPALGAEEAAALLSWALPPAWAGDAAVSADLRASRLATALHRAAALGACTQVEYFFIGTDNGHVFLMPLLPPHLLEALVAECGETTLPELAYLWKHETELAQAAARSDVSAARAIGQGSRAPLNCVGRRLLHRHAREEPVTVMDHLGTLFASAAPPGDTSVAVSMFHPLPASITCLPHPSAVRSIKLWEGSAFTASSSHSSSAEEYDTQRQGALQRWHDALRAAEPTAVYLFTGDYAGVVRLWRIDVAAHSYTLQHVLICSANMTGMLSPLTPFAREDNSKKVPSRDADRTVHCLEVDEQAGRVFAGTEGGVYVWAIDALPWRGPESVSANALAEHHPLCWDEERRAPLSCALLHYETSPPYDSDAGSTSPTASSTDSEKIVEYRASRLVNHHVWLLPASTVQSEMARAMERSGGSSADKVSKWKPKYGRVATGGAAVGVVCNTVKLSAVAAASAGASVGDRLTDTAVPVSFEGGELKNGLRVPLSCVVPVAYPLAFLRTPGTACFALRVLAGRRRLVTSCADGKVCVWACHHGKEASSAAVAETYVPQLVTSTLQEHRGLGRHICVLRTPDVFITCSYDDALVREWHVYDEPEALLRCARRFTLTPYSSEGSGVQQQQHADALKKIPHPNMVNGATVDSDLDETWANGGEDGDVVGGISCAAAYPAFGALFLVGAFESAIQTYSLTEVVSCEPPRNYVYNGLKTVRLPASMAEDVYHELPTR